MKKEINIWQSIGFTFTVAVGVLLHFLYEWLNEPILLSPFSGVNESTWEHMKVLFWPMFAFAVFQSFFFRDKNNFWCVKLRGIVLGIALIPIIYYMYNGVISKSPDWLNIIIFLVSAASAFFCEKRLFDRAAHNCKFPKTAFALLLLIALCFVIFTFKPPHLNIFKDPLTGAYGIHRY